MRPRLAPRCEPHLPPHPQRLHKNLRAHQLDRHRHVHHLHQRVRHHPYTAHPHARRHRHRRRALASHKRVGHGAKPRRDAESTRERRRHHLELVPSKLHRRRSRLAPREKPRHNHQFVGADLDRRRRLDQHVEPPRVRSNRRHRHRLVVLEVVPAAAHHRSQRALDARVARHHERAVVDPPLALDYHLHRKAQPLPHEDGVGQVRREVHFGLHRGHLDHVRRFAVQAHLAGTPSAIEALVVRERRVVEAHHLGVGGAAAIPAQRGLDPDQAHAAPAHLGSLLVQLHHHAVSAHRRRELPLCRLPIALNPNKTDQAKACVDLEALHH